MRLQLTLLAFLLCSIGHAQDVIPVFGPQKYISGYEREREGETLTYFSLYHKYVKEALLTRCTDGRKAIAWETDVIPADIKGQYAYFSWVTGHSSGTSSGIRKFDLYINDNLVLTFATHPKVYPPYWTYGAADSTRLLFVYKKQDAAHDAHGMSYLRVPLSKYKKGQKLRMKIVGHNQDSNDWYMVFKYSFKEKIDFAPLPFITRTGKEQPIQISILHFGGPNQLTLKVNSATKTFPVVDGFSSFEITVPAVSSPTVVKVEAEIPGSLHTVASVKIKPVVPREINLIHHSHTDIGYSHLQEQVIEIHDNNIKHALLHINKTASYPEGSRFIWNIESSWAVENFLNEATSDERKQFIAAAKSGSIAVSGTYANILTGLCTPEEMNWITEYSCKLRDSLGIPVRTAMMSDIPGMSWSLVSALAKNGIRYFSNGPNYVQNLPDRGDRIGHTLREQGNKAFWWRSSAGVDSILVWTCGKGYSSWHGFAEGAVFERGPEHIASYMYELDSIGYPYDMVQWRYNIVADNAPVDGTIPDFVKAWNEKYVTPKLVLANVTEMFERFEKKYGSTIPTLTGDFTPYWEDGAYSTSREESENRLLSQKLQSLLAIAAARQIQLDPSVVYQAKRNIVLFHEHTWGSWNSISEPDVTFTTSQWKYKKGFLDSARLYVAAIEKKLKNKLAQPGLITVINPLPWTRSGLVEMKVPSGFQGNVLIDADGKQVPIQLENGILSFVAENIAASSARVFKPAKVKKLKPLPFTPAVTLTADTLTGSIKTANALGAQWVDHGRHGGLMQVHYVKGLNPDLFELTRATKIENVSSGPVSSTTRVSGNGAGFNSVVYNFTQFNRMDYLRLSVTLDKKEVRAKESVHLALPFKIENPDVRIGIDNTFIKLPEGQIPGSNKDFFSVQRWLDVSGSNRGVTLTSPQLALWEVGTMVNEEKVVNGYKKWKDTVTPSATVFLYAMNNYWHTNYKADQNGEVTFDLYLHFHTTFDEKKANQFAYEITQPLMGF